VRPRSCACNSRTRPLELGNVIANYPFESSRGFRRSEPNSGHGDHSRLSCREPRAAPQLQLQGGRRRAQSGLLGRRQRRDRVPPQSGRGRACPRCNRGKLCPSRGVGTTHQGWHLGRRSAIAPRSRIVSGRSVVWGSCSARGEAGVVNAGAPARRIRRWCPRPVACRPPNDAALPPVRNVRRPAAPGSGFAGRPGGCSRRSTEPSWGRASRAVSLARRCWRSRTSRASSWLETRRSSAHCS
jgi:hypothetical protein